MRTINVTFVSLIGLSVFFGFLNFGYSWVISLGFAVTSSIISYIIANYISGMKLKVVISFSIALAIALVIANLISSIIAKFTPSVIHSYIYLVVNLIFIYIFFSFSYNKRKDLKFGEMLRFLQRDFSDVLGRPKLVDTSALIDGRILELAKEGILEGELLIPKFVIGEVQHIADSLDSLRREKGRRGISVLEGLKQLSGKAIKVEIIADNPRNREVDHRLINIARARRVPIITTDYNLQKLAEIQGVEVINLNKVTRALAPPVMLGDKLKIRIVREGKEPDQGIGYLDDGTMVVVDHARKYMGKEIEVEVVSIYQSDTGRIIFGRKQEEIKI
ncbi:MAG: PIN domain-containing protein [candidate division WOR-3 bacterium]